MARQVVEHEVRVPNRGDGTSGALGGIIRHGFNEIDYKVADLYSHPAYCADVEQHPPTLALDLSHFVQPHDRRSAALEHFRQADLRRRRTKWPVLVITVVEAEIIVIGKYLLKGVWCLR